ncbi:MAG: aminotransferase class III-fold pyridoxal phosphate-dependent enzyme [Nannocystaceae bacterium]
MHDRRWPTYANREVMLEGAADEDPRGSLRVRDGEGRVFLDAIGGIGCTPLGHAHPAWRAAVDRQLGRLVSVANTFWTQPQQQLATRLTDLFCVPHARVFFCNSGTEATEAAIKLVLRATGRDTIIAFDGAFHGRSLGAVSLTANPHYRAPYVTTPEDGEASRFASARVLRLPFDDVDALRDAFRRHGPSIAAVFVEPVQGESGIFPCSRAFLCEAREQCDRHGSLLGLDEIQSGSGRTGRWSAWQSIVGDEIQPDLLWLAKALGGGFPIGACLATESLAEHMSPGSHGSTFGGNPVACAAGVATLRIMEEEGLLECAAAQLPALRALAEATPLAGVAEIRGVGAMIGIQIGQRSEKAGNQVARHLAESGILVTVCGGHTIRLLFPYRVGHAELETVWQAIGAALVTRG